MRLPCSLVVVFLVSLIVSACGDDGNGAPPDFAVTALTPDSGQVGDIITVGGQSMGEDGVLTVGGVVANVSFWTDAGISFEIPTVAPGTQVVEVDSDNGGQGSINLNVLGAAR